MFEVKRQYVQRSRSKRGKGSKGGGRRSASEEEGGRAGGREPVHWGVEEEGSRRGKIQGEVSWMLFWRRVGRKVGAVHVLGDVRWLGHSGSLVRPVWWWVICVPFSSAGRYSWFGFKW
jgi:hypothetical protein